MAVSLQRLKSCLNFGFDMILHTVNAGIFSPCLGFWDEKVLSILRIFNNRETI
jgi:hypothetical protein